MSSILAIFKQYMYNNVRDKLSLFWHLLFPVVLLVILILIFSGVDNGSIQFAVTLVDKTSSTSQQEMVDIAEIFHNILMEEWEKDAWLRLYLPEEGEDLELFLDKELQALSQRERHLLLVIPEGFNQRVMEGVGWHMMGVTRDIEEAEMTIYHRAHNQPSEIAASIFETIIGEMNYEINKEMGFIEEEDLLTSSSVIVHAAQGRSFSYNDYIVPGVILMGFIMTGLFLCFGSLLSLRDRGVLRRYFVTPLSAIQYFSGLMIWILLLSLFQILLVYGVGYLFFSVNIEALSFEVLLYYLYALVVVISFGFFVASLARTADSGDALANLILYPMMFLGGLFFPVEHVPPFIQVFIQINPATYLVNGIRDVLGVYPSFTSHSLNILVPGLWLLFSILFSLKTFRWEAS